MISLATKIAVLLVMLVPLMAKPDIPHPEQCRVVAKMRPWYFNYMTRTCCKEYNLLCEYRRRP